MTLEMKEIILNGTSLLSIPPFIRQISVATSISDLRYEEICFDLLEDDSYFAIKFMIGIQRLDLSYSRTLNGNYLEYILINYLVRYFPFEHSNKELIFWIETIYPRCRYLEVLSIDFQFFYFECQYQKICLFNISDGWRKIFLRDTRVQEKGSSGKKMTPFIFLFFFVKKLFLLGPSFFPKQRNNKNQNSKDY